MKFSNFVLSEEQLEANLSRQDIYDFYFMVFEFRNITSPTAFQRSEVEEFLKYIINIYLDQFGNLIIAQLEKYLQRKRHDTDSSGKPVFDIEKIKKMSGYEKYENLDKAMKSTYRSDMTRRNDRWNMLTDYLRQLAQTHVSIPDAIFIIDRINNTVHNTHELMLTKFKNGYALKQAFDEVHAMRNAEQLRYKASSRVKDIFEV